MEGGIGSVVVAVATVATVPFVASSPTPGCIWKVWKVALEAPSLPSLPSLSSLRRLVANTRTCMEGSVGRIAIVAIITNVRKCMEGSSTSAVTTVVTVRRGHRRYHHCRSPSVPLFVGVVSSVVCWFVMRCAFAPFCGRDQPRSVRMTTFSTRMVQHGEQLWRGVRGGTPPFTMTRHRYRGAIRPPSRPQHVAMRPNINGHGAETEPITQPSARLFTEKAIMGKTFSGFM